MRIKQLWVKSWCIYQSTRQTIGFFRTKPPRAIAVSYVFVCGFVCIRMWPKMAAMTQPRMSFSMDPRRRKPASVLHPNMVCSHKNSINYVTNLRSLLLMTLKPHWNALNPHFPENLGSLTTSSVRCWSRSAAASIRRRWQLRIWRFLRHVRQPFCRETWGFSSLPERLPVCLKLPKKPLKREDSLKSTPWILGAMRKSRKFLRLHGSFQRLSWSNTAQNPDQRARAECSRWTGLLGVPKH